MKLQRSIAIVVALSLLIVPTSAQQFIVATPSVQLSSANGSFANGVITISADDVLLSSAPFIGDALIIGAGGGGGLAGGGGAGRPQLFTNISFNFQTVIKVGRGGAGNATNGKSNAGDFSAIYTTAQGYVSTGGSPVGILNTNSAQFLTGSGGGAPSSSSGGPYLGGPGEGLSNENAGGAGPTNSSPFPGGGGGGCGSAGTAASGTAPGNGGNGCFFTIGGYTLKVAAGGIASCFSNGGGGCNLGTGDVAAGAGAGATPGTSGAGGQGTDGTGSGGGGGYNVGAGGGRGGDGVVIIFPHGNFTYGVTTIQPSAAVRTDAIGSNLLFDWHVVRLASWAGNCLQVTRASDSATLDIPYVNNVCSWAAADQFAAAARSTYAVSKLYDNSGNGNDATCSSSAGLTLPTFSHLNTWTGGLRPISFDGQGNTAFQACSIATVTGNTNAVSVFMAASPRTSTDFQGYWSLSNSTFTTYFTSLYHNSGSNLRLASTDTGFYPRGAPGLISASLSGTSGQIVDVNGSSTTLGNAGSNAFSGFRIGIASAGNVYGIFDLFGVQLYGQSTTAGQITAVKAAMSAPLKLQTSFSHRVIYSGDSLSSTSLLSTLNQNVSWQAGFGKSTNGPIPSWEPYLMSVAGRTLATEATQTSIYSGLFTAGAFYYTNAATNDIAAFTCASQVDCENQADTLYNGTLLPFFTTLKGFGYAVGIGTAIARGSETTVNFQEYARLKWNLDVINGAGANGYTVGDRANAGPGSAFNSVTLTNDTTRYCGGTTHLCNLGYFGVGPVDRTAIGAVN